MDVSPGPIPKDGEGINPEVDLEAMVNQTSISNLEKEQFVNTWAPFIVAATDAPASSTRVPGLLWYKQGEGRLYMWNTQLPIVSSGSVGTWFLEGESGAEWQCVSDRKEIYCRAFNEDGQRPTNGPLPGWGVVCADFGSSLPDIRWLLAGSNPKWWGPQVQGIASVYAQGKFWASCTNYTVQLDHVAGGMYHDLGYRRVPLDSANTAPGYGFLSWDSYLTAASLVDIYDQNIGLNRCVANITHSGPPDVDADTGVYRGLTYWLPCSTRTAWGKP